MSRKISRIPPLLWAIFMVVGMVGISVSTPKLQFNLPGGLLVALALVCAGASVCLCGVWAFRQHATTVNPLTPGAATHIVDTGIFRYSRNPMYLGFALILAGVALGLSHPLAMMLLPAFIFIMNCGQIHAEELALATKFGDAYAQYAARVRRWL